MELTLQQWQFALDNCGIPRGKYNLAFRIENTMMSVAKYAGGMRLDGELYLYVNPVNTADNCNRVDLVVREDLVKWAMKNMGADSVSDKPKRVPFSAIQGELFNGCR